MSRPVPKQTSEPGGFCVYRRGAQNAIRVEKEEKTSETGFRGFRPCCYIRMKGREKFETGARTG